jgi:hypothetical protein
VSKSLNKVQWSGTWSSVLCYLAGRIASPLEPTIRDAIFLSVRVVFWSGYGPYVQTCEFRYVTVKGSKLASGRLALGSGKGCQSQNMRNGMGMLFPKSHVLLKISFYMPQVESSS